MHVRCIFQRICKLENRKWLKNSIFSHFTPLNIIMTSSVMMSSKWVFFQKKFWPFFDNPQGLLWHLCPFLRRKRSKNSIFSHFTPLNAIMTSSVMTSSKWVFFQKRIWPFFDNSRGLLWHICPFLGRKRLKNSIFSHLTPLNAIMTSSVMTSSKWVFKKNCWPISYSVQGLLWHICLFLAWKWLKNTIFSHFTPPLNTIMTSSVMTSSKWRFFQKNSWCFFDNS